MLNPIKNWFFELIEDAIGTTAMNRFKEEDQRTRNQTSKLKKSNYKNEKK